MSEPNRLAVSRDDVAYIVDALIDAAHARRQRKGRLQEAIADHIEDLAITLYDWKPDEFEARR